MNITSIRSSLTLAAVLAAASLSAQATAPGTIHGKVTNAIGAPVVSGEVKLTTDRSSEAKDRKYQYTFPVDATGNFKGDGIAPNDYVLVYFDKGVSVDFIDHVIIKAGEDKLADDDMTREEYQKTLSPELKKQYAELKAKNAAALAANSKVGNINQLLTKARQERTEKKYDEAYADMQQAVQLKPDEALLYNELGNSQYDLKKFDDAAVSYNKAIELNAVAKKPLPEITSTSYAQLGLSLARSGKNDEATAAFEKAAAAEPAKAGTFYYNAAAVLYNAGNTDAAAAAADKAIAADPKRAEAYYIKGQSLIGKSTVKNDKIVPPPGCLEAYSTYLELDPNGRHAADVKGIIAGFDDKVVSNYKATKKK